MCRKISILGINLPTCNNIVLFSCLIKCKSNTCYFIFFITSIYINIAIDIYIVLLKRFFEHYLNKGTLF